MAMLLPDDRLARVEEQVEQLLKVNQAMADLIASLVSHHLRGQHSHHLAPGTPWSPAPSEVEEEGTGQHIPLCQDCMRPGPSLALITLQPTIVQLKAAGMKWKEQHTMARCARWVDMVADHYNSSTSKAIPDIIPYDFTIAWHGMCGTLEDGGYCPGIELSTGPGPNYTAE